MASIQQSTVTVGLLVPLKAKPGKEEDVARFLEGGLQLVEEEPDTTAWFAVRLGPSEFAIFDAFPDDSGRQAHLSGRVAEALMAQAVLESPALQRSDILKALRSLKRGDFSVRLPIDLVGMDGEIANAFNEVVELNDSMAREFERISAMVGREGKIRHRVTLGLPSGAWGARGTTESGSTSS